LPDVLDRDAVAARVRQLLRMVPRGNPGTDVQARILRDALDQAARVGEEFALELLALTGPTLDALPQPSQADEFEGQAKLLGRALFVAAHFDRPEYLQQLVERLQRLLQAQRESPTTVDFDKVVDRCFRGLRKLGMHKEIDHLLQLMARLLLRDRDLSAVEDPEWRAKNAAALRTLLHVAAGWFYFGRDAEALTVLKAARAELLAPLPKPADNRPQIDGQTLRARTALARAYASALSQAPVELAKKRFEELFEKLEGFLDCWTTNEYYSQSQIQVVEAVVLAVVSDDFTVGPHVRRWLDDDEYLLRRRIHRDVRALVTH
jgi:hypothetical protein